MTTLNPKLSLELLTNKNNQRRSAKGFTLIELMVTVATLGTLAAVAFPAFSGAANRAAAGATIGSQQAFAKECAVNVITDNTTEIDLGAADITMSTLDCASANADVTVKNGNAFVGSAITGLKCVDAVNSSTLDVKCTITVDDTTGAISGAWGTS